MEKRKRQKQKPGRPLKENKKEIRAAVRFTKKDYQTLEEKASKSGLTTSEFIRQTALLITIQSRLTAEEVHFVRQLIGMSNNLNQVAKICNREGLFEAMRYFENFRGEMDSILKKLKP